MKTEKDLTAILMTAITAGQTMTDIELIVHFIQASNDHLDEAEANLAEAKKTLEGIGGIFQWVLHY